MTNTQPADSALSGTRIWQTGVDRVAAKMASFLDPFGLAVSADSKNNTITIRDTGNLLPAMQLRLQPKGPTAMFVESKGQWQDLFCGNSSLQQGKEKGVQETSIPSTSPNPAPALLLHRVLNDFFQPAQPGSLAARTESYRTDRGRRPAMAPAAAPPEVVPPTFQTPFDQLLQQLQLQQPQ